MKRIFLLFIFIFIFLSCYDAKNKYNLDYKSFQNLEQLLTTKNEISSAENLVLWLKEIQKLFNNKNKMQELIIFSGELAEKEKKEDFKSIIYFFISDLYWELGNKDAAVLYMTKIKKPLYKVQYNFNDIGYLIAKRIINYDYNVKIKEKMFKILISEYKEKIDIIETYSAFSDYYKAVYEIHDSASVLSKFIFTDTLINENNSEDSNIKNEIIDEINFYNIKKYWIYEDLDSLISRIKNSIKEKNKRSLDQYISPINFTIKLLQKNNSQNWTYKELEIEKRINDRISFSDKFESMSNNDEVFLKTENWDFPRLSTWYLYFKKVYYPFDNKINGAWEWAGIYFGETY